MTEVDRIAETIVPACLVHADEAPPFLQGQQIFVWDAPMQTST
jgi:hypothetical protein